MALYPTHLEKSRHHECYSDVPSDSGNINSGDSKSTMTGKIAANNAIMGSRIDDRAACPRITTGYENPHSNYDAEFHRNGSL